MRQLIVTALAAAVLLQAQSPRIPRPIGDPSTLAPVKSQHPLARQEFDLGPAAPSMRLGYVTLVLKPTPAQQTDLETLLTQQQDRSSANYHKWLTPEQFGDRFGLAASDLTLIKTWLTAHGFHVEDTARARNWIAFSGTVAQLDRALHTGMHRYRVNGKDHYANSANPSLPPVLANVVRYFRGLDDFEPEAPIGASMATPVPDFTASSGSHSLAPDDFATIYDIKPLYNAGINGAQQSLVVVGRTDITIPDYQTFRTLYGLPATVPTLHLVGPDPGAGAFSDYAEAMADVEVSGAVARNATIIYVYSTSINTDYQEAVDKNLAPVITSSYSSCEPDSADSIRDLAQQANAQGITWMVVTNDSGAAACHDHAGPRPQVSTGLAIAYPTSIPEITAVGGTQFSEGSGSYWASSNSSTGASALSYIPEIGWNNDSSTGIYASGGGVSIFYPKPVWQNGPGVPNDSARDIPDLAMTASGHDGYRTFYNGLNYVFSGTSAATPSFAGVVALLNQYQVKNGFQTAAGMGNINPELYRLAQTYPAAFHDITTGNNIDPCVQSSHNCQNGTLGYTAGPGYDLVTGLGSVDVNNFVTHWGQNGDPSKTSVSANPATSAFDTKPQLTATVTGAGGTPTGTVAFLVPNVALGVPNLGSAALNSSGTATLTVDPNQLAIGVNNITAVYSGDSKFDISSGTTTVTVTAPTGSAAIVASCSPNPVYSESQSSDLPAWHYTLTLTNLSNVAATLTGFTLAGTDESAHLSNYFSATTIPADGKITAAITQTGVTPPETQVLAFSGKDANGNAWNQQITVPFVAPLLLPELVLTGGALPVQQNPGNPGCPWMQRLNLQEIGGYNMQITRFTAGSTDLTGQVSQYFGTTEIAPLGALQATVCSTGTAPLPSIVYQVQGTSDSGSTWNESFTSTFAAAVAQPAALSVSQSSVALSSTPATINVNLGGGNSTWTASIFPSNPTTNWLTISPASGTGSGTITLTANAAGQTPGAYRATVIVQGSSSIPQFIEVPVSFTVGGAPSIGIAGVSNAASFQTNFAPGMIMSVFGTGLAPAIQAAGSVPLPLTMQGVTATVNGVSAPLYFVSPGQINLQIPYETGASSAVVGIDNNGSVASFQFTTSPTAPGIFAAGGNLVPAYTATPGSVLVLFMTGEGDVNPELVTGTTPAASTALSNLPQPRIPVTVTVGGITASTLFVGIPSALVGVTQINFVVPSNVPLGTQPVVVTSNGAASAPVNITVSAH